MLHIENIDEYSVRFGDGYGGGTYTKVFHKNLEARKDEEDLIWIWHKENNECILNAKSVDEITLNGTVYGTAEAFVVAFQNMIYSTTAYTTTTTTAAVTTTTTTA